MSFFNFYKFLQMLERVFKKNLHTYAVSHTSTCDFQGEYSAQIS